MRKNKEDITIASLTPKGAKIGKEMFEQAHFFLSRVEEEKMSTTIREIPLEAFFNIVNDRRIDFEMRYRLMNSIIMMLKTIDDDGKGSIKEALDFLNERISLMKELSR